MKGEGFISCDTITKISGRSSLECIIESVHFIKLTPALCSFILVVNSMPGSCKVLYCISFIPACTSGDSSHGYTEEISYILQKRLKYSCIYHFKATINLRFIPEGPLKANQREMHPLIGVAKTTCPVLLFAFL
jgi:hypothetical protein